MQVWIFNPFDDIPNEGKPQRFCTLADTLLAQGHSVVWWSSDFSHRRKAWREAPSESEGVGVPPLGGHPDGLASPLSNARSSKSLVWNHSATQPLNFSLRLISTPPYTKNISFARIRNHHAYGRNLYRDACAAIDSGELLKPDLILASLPPMEGPIAALRLRKRYGCRVVTDIMDAWPETLLHALPRCERSKGDGSDALQPSSVSLRCEQSESVGVPPLGGHSEGSDALQPSSVSLRCVQSKSVGVPPLGGHSDGSDALQPSVDTSGWLKSLGRLLLFPYYRMLRRACRESDAISAQSQTFADFARQHGARGEIHVCYLGANAPTSPPFHLPTFPLKRSCRLLYLGSMGRSYDLATLLTATLNLLRQGLELELHIAGGGQQLEALKGMAADAPAGAIHFHGFLQEPELSELLRSSDVGVVPMFPESGVAVPYKVGDYLSAGLAVVNSLPGELDELLQESNCGRFYEAKSVTSLEGALKHYLEKGSIDLLEDKKNARALFERHFDRSKTYPNFAKWIAAQ